MSEPFAEPISPRHRAYQRGASVWVAASAGTGKTTVLTNRVLAMLLHGSPPSRILCLTFTKAAAAEMAIRINENLSRWTILNDGALGAELEKLTGKLPDQDDLDCARRLFVSVLDAPGGMTIATIHAFCQSLLRRFPIEARVAPHFELMDERSSSEVLEVARETVLERARSGSAPELADALAEIVLHVQEARFSQLLAELALERARLGGALARGVDHLAAALRHDLELAPGETTQRIVEAACIIAAGNEKRLRAAAEAMIASASTNDKQRGNIMARWLATPEQRAAGFEAYCRAFFTLDGDPFKNIVTKKLAETRPDIAEIVLAEAARLQKIRQRLSAAETYAASVALIRIAGAIFDEYETLKTARALLDYDDLVLKTRDLLRRPGIAPWVLFKLDGGLDHILIDEAQDTNPEQWEIVKLIAEEFFSGQGAREAARTLFVVGDAKQSIFSFQRADPTKFMEMRAHFEAAVTAARAKWHVIPLELSFRSVAAVLRAVDMVFAQERARDGVALDGLAIRHDVFRDGAAGLVELWPPVEPRDEPVVEPWSPPLVQRQAREPRTRLALAIAATIQRWFQTGERLAASDRPIQAGDIMVLVRRRDAFVVELVRALKQANIPVAGVDRMILTDQLAVEDMIALGNFLLLPEDDLTLATVLKGPLFQFTEEALFDLAWQRSGKLWTELLRRREETPDFARAASELNALLARADFVPPYELFAEVLSARQGRKAVLGRLGPEARDPLDEFLAAALGYERAHGVSLQGFLHWLGASEVEIKRDLDQGGRSEVRVLTVHGAKGLEAPVVFLPDTLQIPPQIQQTFWTERGLPLWVVERRSPPSLVSTVLGEAQARRDQEYRRLLYVAMTRASDRLYVCGWQTKRAAPSGNWYALVAAGMAEAGAAKVPFDSRSWLGAEGWVGEALRLTTPQTAKPKIEKSVNSIRAGAAILPPWTWHPPPPEPAPPKPLAPSQPLHSEPAARSPLGQDRGAAFLHGRLVHRLLQSLPRLDPDKRETAARRFLARPVHGLTEAAQASILHETMAVLEHPDFAPLFATDSAAEVPVVGLVNGRALAGQIDRLVVTGDSVLIVDYKTMRPVPQGVDEVPTAYLDQLAAYRAAVEAVYPGKEVRCALLWTDGPCLMPIDSRQLDHHF